MRGAIVAASVSLKWALNDEEAVANAVALRDDHLRNPDGFPLFAPTLWLFEIANGLYVAARRERLPMEELEETLADMLAIGVKLLLPDIYKTLRLSASYQVAAYDAAYLALAEELGLELWVGDRRFYDTISSIKPEVKWIGDYPVG